MRRILPQCRGDKPLFRYRSSGLFILDIIEGSPQVRPDNVDATPKDGQDHH
jgi:hypothetical protein